MNSSTEFLRIKADIGFWASMIMANVVETEWVAWVFVVIMVLFGIGDLILRRVSR